MNVPQQLRALAGRVRMGVARAIVSSIDDAQQAQALQLELLADEAQDNVERFQNYGFTAHPHPGAEAAMISVGGLRSHGIVIAVEDRRYRLKGLQRGEVAIYDDLDQVVHLTRDGILIMTDKDVTIDAGEDVLVRAGGEVKVEAASVLVESDEVQLGGAGGPAVARVGDSVAGGVITSGSSKVTAA